MKYLIEDNWYLVPDDYSWALGKHAGGFDKKTGEPHVRLMTFHETPEQALNYYLRQKQREKAIDHTDGDLKDLIGIFIAERNRLADVLQNTFSQACEVELKKPHTEDSEE